MRKDKEGAISLRKSGLTYSEIKERIGVPMSTLSSWFREQKWSNDLTIEHVRMARDRSAVRLVVLNTVRGSRLAKLYQEARQEAIMDFEGLKYHPLFIAGLMLYRAEGDRTSKHRVSVANVDPMTIRIFKMFLERICGANGYKIWLLLRPDAHEDQCKEYWMSKCALKQGQFSKNIVIKGLKARKSSADKAHYGVCNIGVSSAYLKNKILKWIELLDTEICEEKYEQIQNAGIV